LADAASPTTSYTLVFSSERDEISDIAAARFAGFDGVTEFSAAGRRVDAW
jgi:hypothetical protein